MPHAPCPLSGITLTELIIASGVGVVILLAVGQMDVTGIFVGNQVRSRIIGQTEGALALSQIARSLERADRINLVSASNVQLRIPIDPAGDLNDPANYEWFQFRFDPLLRSILFFGPGCSLQQSFLDINSLLMQYRDEAPAPPGGEPPQQDNNILQATLTWLDTRLTSNPSDDTLYTYTNQVTIRSGSYSNLFGGACVPAGPGDSGPGLAPCGVSNPPSSC